MAKRVKPETNTPPDVLAEFERFRETQLGRLLAMDPPRGLRVRDLPPDGQRRAVMAAVRGRVRTAPADDWSHKLDPEAADW